MLKKTKFIAMSILSIVMCSSLIAGATYALFTSDSTTNIAITSGNVDVKATATIAGGSSLNAVKNYTTNSEGKVVTTVNGEEVVLTEDDYYTFTSNADKNYSGYYLAEDATTGTDAKGRTTVTFANEGTASIDANNANKLILNNITPGDSVKLKIDVVNNSNVTVNYRIKFYCDEETNLTTNQKDSDRVLFDSLKIDIPVQGGSFTKTSLMGVWSYSTAWTELKVPTTEKGKTVISSEATIELPLTIGNAAKNRTCEVYYVVEAVQGNANLGDNQIELGYINTTKSGAGKSQTVTATENGVANETTVSLANVIAGNAKTSGNEDASTPQTADTGISVKIPSTALTKTTTTGEGGEQQTINTAAKSVEVNVTSTTVDNVNDELKLATENNKISVGAGDTVYAFDVKATADGASLPTITTEGVYYETSFNVDTDVTELKVYHNENLLAEESVKVKADDEYYTYVNGKVTVYTKSFSPFVISYFLGGGDGTESNPYKINSVLQLEAFALSVNLGNNFSTKYVKLMRDLDLKGINWMPIGNEKNYFLGVFDGAKSEEENYTISNLTSIHEDMYYVGLFGHISDGAEVKNINFYNVNLNGIGYVGTAVGQQFTGKVSGINVEKATINAGRWVGGIVGYTYGSITNCSTKDATITAVPFIDGGKYDNGDKVGGIVGWSASVTISGCTVDNVKVTGYRDIGGIAGYQGKDGSDPLCKDNTIKNSTIKLDTTNAYNEQSQYYAATAGRRGDNWSNDTLNTVENVTYEIYIAPSSTYSTLPATIQDGTRIYGDSAKSANSVIGLPTEYTLTAKNVTFENLTINIEQKFTVRGDNVTFNNVIVNVPVIEKAFCINGEYAKFTNTNIIGGSNVTYGASIDVYSDNIEFDNCYITGKYAFRSIQFWSLDGEAIIKNSTLAPYCYTINVDRGTGKLNVSNTTLKGWTSYTKSMNSIIFTNCSFEPGNWNVVAAHTSTTFNNCTFNGTIIYTQQAIGFSWYFNNCKYGSDTLTADNLVKLIDTSAKNNDNPYYFVDGTRYSYSIDDKKFYENPVIVENSTEETEEESGEEEEQDVA